MAPLTRNRADNDTGIPSPMASEYYAQRASAGLIITEASQISPLAKGYVCTPGIYTQDQVAAWKDITRAVHEKGGKIFIQLWHVGRISHVSVLPDGETPVAPSEIVAKNAQTITANGREDVSKPRALTTEDIQNTIADYAAAAQNAKDAGFDGIEIHGANGYLIDQFLQDSSNKRTDEYGGSAENRSRFLLEIIEAVTKVWDSSRVGLRLSPTGVFNDMGDSDPLQTFGTLIHLLNDYDLAYLHFVERFPNLETADKDLRILDTLRRQWHGFYIANGDYNKQRAESSLEKGTADAVAFGRPYIANPDLVDRMQKGAVMNEIDAETIYGGDAKGYIDYPSLSDVQAA